MPEMARWNNHIFEVSPDVMRSFSSLSITGSATTEEKETGQQKYVSYKNGGATQVSMTAILSVFMGCSVRDEAMAFVDEARRGCYGYLYMDGKKLVACPLMLTNASVSKTDIAPESTWVYAEVKLTFKQCDKYDGESSGSSGSSGSGSSSKKGSVKSETTTEKTDWRVTYTSRLPKGAAAPVSLAGTKGLRTTTTETKSWQQYIDDTVTKEATTRSKNTTTAGKGKSVKVQQIK